MQIHDSAFSNVNQQLELKKKHDKKTRKLYHK